MDKPLLKNFVDYLLKSGIIKVNFTGTYTLVLAFRNGGIRDVKQRTEQVHIIQEEKVSIS